MSVKDDTSNPATLRTGPCSTNTNTNTNINTNTNTNAGPSNPGTLLNALHHALLYISSVHLVYIIHGDVLDIGFVQIFKTVTVAELLHLH